jgi:hypothetical protein
VSVKLGECILKPNPPYKPIFVGISFAIDLIEKKIKKRKKKIVRMLKRFFIKFLPKKI